MVRSPTLVQASKTSLTLCNVNWADNDSEVTILEHLLELTGSHTKTGALHFAVNLQSIVKSTLMAGFTEYWLPFLDEAVVDSPAQWLLQCAQTML